MQSQVDVKCPQCHVDGQVSMLSLSSEIPYFGEHTQITIICDSCGWKHTDFIPSDGDKQGFWIIKIDDQQKNSARIIRSSSCTIRIPELDLEVSPGGSASGYITNIEGVLKRFIDAVKSVIRDLETTDSDFLTAQDLLKSLQSTVEGSNVLTIELLDPRGRSQIIHDEAESRDLNDSELSTLSTGPELPVFEID
ncbi:MAG: hypothetical protein CMA12_03700 [Euryarchaeota archaeon]|nr:hypothetical protein [Euryarchaeota archaeon]OUW22590.1 MAG: hypothetical protein CBD33_02045 [Euryarchaeota archaeon TMED173]|tara:strand:+ start:304 stop:885 length:582 start_codon:yes stop_codon:yes gene_type:complete